MPPSVEGGQPREIKPGSNAVAWGKLKTRGVMEMRIMKVQREGESAKQAILFSFHRRSKGVLSTLIITCT